MGKYVRDITQRFMERDQEVSQSVDETRETLESVTQKAMRKIIP